MTSPDSTVLCRYRYDPLDRLASSSLAGQADVQRFYQKNRLATEIQGTVRRTVFQHEDLLLAQQRRTDDRLDTTLLATDQQRSVLQLVDKTGTEPMAYSVYGHHPAESGLTSLLGFNGERRDPATGHYLLGNGYRAYNPVLMRFNSPDSLSPFDEGGLNAYGYVGGDPVGFVDPSGHITIVAIRAISKVGFLSFRKARIISKPVTSKLKQLVSQNDQSSVVTSTGATPFFGSAVNQSSSVMGSNSFASTAPGMKIKASGGSSSLRTRRGGVRKRFASTDLTVKAALKEYKSALKEVGLKRFILIVLFIVMVSCLPDPMRRKFNTAKHRSIIWCVLSVKGLPFLTARLLLIRGLWWRVKKETTLSIYNIRHV